MSLTAKKIYSVILLVVMLSGIFSTVLMAQAAQAPTFTLSNTAAARPGKTFDVTVSLNANAGFCAGEFTVSYDSDVLEPVSITQGNAAGTYFVSNTEYAAGQVFFAMIDTELLTDAGTVATIRFRVKDYVMLYNGKVDLEVGTLVGNTAEGYGYKTVSSTANDGNVSAAQSISVAQIDNPEQTDVLSVSQKGTELLLSGKRSSDLTATQIAKNFASSLTAKFFDSASNELAETKKLTTGCVIKLYSNNALMNTVTVSVKGDVNGDDRYDGYDAYLAGLLNSGVLTADQIGAAADNAADINNDGVVDENDFEALESNGLN